MADNRLNHLLTYTIFHLGVYVTLFCSLIGASIFTQKDHIVMRFAVGCFVFAGICGAVVGSNITRHVDYDSYSSARLGYWRIGIWRYQTWAHMQHLSFWVGVLTIAVPFVLYGKDAFS